MKEGVERDKDLDAVGMGIVDKCSNVVEAVAGGFARTEARGTNIYGVCTGLNGSFGDG